MATKRDLDALGSSLRSEMTLRLEALEHRLRAEISTSARTALIAHIGTTIGAIIAVAGLR